jgi:glucokinase
MIEHALSQRGLFTVYTDLVAEFTIHTESYHSVPQSAFRHPRKHILVRALQAVSGSCAAVRFVAACN